MKKKNRQKVYRGKDGRFVSAKTAAKKKLRPQYI